MQVLRQPLCIQILHPTDIRVHMFAPLEFVPIYHRVKKNGRIQFVSSETM
jgi:hypothetical protein